MRSMTVFLIITLLVASMSFIPIPSKAIKYSKNTDLSIMGASYVGQSADDYAGFSVAGVGDVNNDGFDDILIGAPDSGGWDEGQAYLIFGKSSGWIPDMNLAQADASFFGEHIYSDVGWSSAGAGDVNGDGFDDIIIGANGNDGRGFHAGQAYLVFGKSSGWAMGTSLSNVAASYIGVGLEDQAGYCVAGSGDINNDTYDDVIISAPYNDDGGSNSGQTYVVFGNDSGWSMDNTISNTDASFIGESSDDHSGRSIAVLGDVNGDGYDDIIIGAHQNDDGGDNAGKSYLVFGNASGWEKNTNLASVNVSFLGEYAYDYSGYSVAAAGDINGDKLDDILIGAYKNDEAGADAGQTYIIFGKTSGWGEDVNLSNADASFLGEAAGDLSGCSLSSAGDVNADGFDDILIGAFRQSDADLVYLILGNATGWFMDMNLSEADASFFGEGRISIHSLSSAGDFNDDGYDDILIGHPYNDLASSYTGKAYLVFPELNYTPPITLYPSQDNPTATEDEQYNAHYWSVNATVDTWIFETNASWLEWNETNHDISGIPDNTDVGSFWVRINITNETFGYDEHNFTVTVGNVPPEIITSNTLYTYEDSQYLVDYDSTDDGQGIITWSLSTNASWLSFNSTTGVISGTPVNEQVGEYYVNVSADDNNGGMDWSNFTLTVLNTNDAPIWVDVSPDVIIWDTEAYTFDFNATDVDKYDTLEYRIILVSHLGDKEYLVSINETTGILEFSSGDVGVYLIEIGFTDQSTMIYHDFQVDVRNASTQNIPPTADLVFPGDEDEIEVLNPTLRWTVTDVNDDNVTSDLYFGTNPSEIDDLDPDTKIGTELNTTSFPITDALEKGQTYYWTVIPHDGTEPGICSDGIWSFTVNESATINNPPVLEPISNQTVKVGEEFTLTVQGQDADPQDASNLTFSLISAPEGMTISTDCVITWTPSKDQVGTYTVVVRLSDGKEFTDTSFEIEIKKDVKDETTSEDILQILLILIIVCAVIATIILLFLMGRKKPGEDMENSEEPTSADDTSQPVEGEQSSLPSSSQYAPGEELPPTGEEQLPYRNDQMPPSYP